MSSFVHRLIVGVAVLLGLVVGAVFGGVPALAHGETGTIEVDVPEPRGDLTVGLRVLVAYDDGDPVEPADLEGLAVVGSGPGGQEAAFVAEFVSVDVPGVHEAELTFPAAGQWELTISSVAPEASTTATVVVAEPAGAVDEPDTSESGEVTDDTIDADVAEGSAQIVERGSGGDGPTSLLVTLALAGALLVAAIVGGVALRRRARSA